MEIEEFICDSFVSFPVWMATERLIINAELKQMEANPWHLQLDILTEERKDMIIYNNGKSLYTYLRR